MFINYKGAIFVSLVIVLSAIVCAAYAFLQYMGIDFVKAWAYNQVTGTMGHANFLGSFYLLAFPLICGLILLSKGLKRLILLGLALFLISNIILVRVRGAWIGLIGSVLFLIWHLFKTYSISIGDFYKRHCKEGIGFLIAILFAIGIIYIANPKAFSEKMALGSLVNTMTIRERFKHYQAGWELFKESPFIGNGIWSYRSRVYEMQAKIGKKDKGYFKNYINPMPRRVHNEYLEIATEVGLLGLTIFLFLLWVVFKDGFYMLNKKEVSREKKTLIISYMASIVGTLVHALFFFPFRIPANAFIFWLQLGTIEALTNEGEQLKVLKINKGLGAPLQSVILLSMSIILFFAFWFGAGRMLLASIQFSNYKRAIARENYEKAEIILKNILKNDPKNSYFLTIASSFYLKYKGDYLKASQYAQDCIKYFDGSIPLWCAYYNLGIIRLKQGRMPEAKNAFENSLYYLPNYESSKRILERISFIMGSRDT